jgi:hypothetical protein
LGISPSLFKKTTTVLEDEEPNVKGVNIDLQASGGLGSYKASLAIDLSGGFSGLSAQEKVALAAAERDDVTYFGDDTAVMSGSPTLNFNALNRTITRTGMGDDYRGGRKIGLREPANSGPSWSRHECRCPHIRVTRLTSENNVQELRSAAGTELEELISALSGTPT